MKLKRMTLAELEVSDTGLCTWSNPGRQTNPLRISIWQGRICLFTSNDIEPTATSYQLPFPEQYAEGDTVELQRVVVVNTLTAVAPTPKGSPPTVVTPPAITDPDGFAIESADGSVLAPTVGELFTVNAGTWTGAPAFTYQWQDCSGLNYTSISGATTSSYTVQSSDVTYAIRVGVAATNAFGTLTVYSLPTGTVSSGGVTPPSNTSIPVVTGTAQQADVLSTTNGVWSNTPTSYAYQWEHSSNGTTWTNISGATSNTYGVQSSDVGDTIRSAVTASNGGGNATAYSAATSTVVSGTVAPINTSIPTVSGTAQQGDTLTGTNGSWSNTPTSYTYQWQRNSSNISGATSISYLAQSADVGDTLRIVVTATNSAGSVSAHSSSTATVTIPSGGNPTQQFFRPSDPFNAPIISDPVLDSNNSSYVSLIAAAGEYSDIATQSDGWPIFYATTNDPVITVDGNYQNATFHLPEGCTPQTPVGGDAHMFVISPDGTRVTEMYGTVVSGTWPDQTVTVASGSSPCQFVISTEAGNTVTNIAGDGTVDGNPSYVGVPGSCRGCAICCIAGLVMEAEFLAALAVENAGGEGLIPHALAATVSFSAAAPYVSYADNTGASGQPRIPAIISDGSTPGGVEESARIQLNPAVDISGLTPPLRVLARTMQVYGWYLTDSTDTGIAFQGQASNESNASWSAALESQGSLAALPWSEMRVLAKWDGS